MLLGTHMHLYALLYQYRGMHMCVYIFIYMYIYIHTHTYTSIFWRFFMQEAIEASSLCRRPSIQLRICQRNLERVPSMKHIVSRGLYASSEMRHALPVPLTFSCSCSRMKGRRATTIGSGKATSRNVRSWRLPCARQESNP
jgi:hypothetical protein